MIDIIQNMLQLSNEVKTMKAYLECIQKTRLQKLHEEWISGDEVIGILKISKRTLQTLRDNGTIPYSRLIGKFYYRMSDIEKLLESNYLNKKK